MDNKDINDNYNNSLQNDLNIIKQIIQDYRDKEYKKIASAYLFDFPIQFVETIRQLGDKGYKIDVLNCDTLSIQSIALNYMQFTFNKITAMYPDRILIEDKIFIEDKIKQFYNEYLTIKGKQERSNERF